MNVFMDGLMAAPLWVQLWVLWLIIVNSASFVFLKHAEGKVIATVWVLNGISMMAAAELLGYNRLLGAVHVVWWTPLVVYLFRCKSDLDTSTWFGRWVMVLLCTNIASLIIDYVDVIRYALGDRA